MPGPHGGILKAKGACRFCEVVTTNACRVCDRPICRDHVVEGELVCIECEVPVDAAAD